VEILGCLLVNSEQPDLLAPFTMNRPTGPPASSASSIPPPPTVNTGTNGVLYQRRASRTNSNASQNGIALNALHSQSQFSSAIPYSTPDNDLRPSVVSIRQFSSDAVQNLNVTLESRTNNRIDYWLEHESIPVEKDLSSYVGSVYQFTNASNSKAIQFVNNWVTVFNALGYIRIK
jgi:hypothetical protein